MLNKPKSKPWALLPLLPLLLTGCETISQLSSPVDAPAIPPLQQQAKQTALPTFSAGAQTDIDQWRKKLIEP